MPSSPSFLSIFVIISFPFFDCFSTGSRHMLKAGKYLHLHTTQKVLLPPSSGHHQRKSPERPVGKCCIFLPRLKWKKPNKQLRPLFQCRRLPPKKKRFKHKNRREEETNKNCFLLFRFPRTGQGNHNYLFSFFVFIFVDCSFRLGAAAAAADCRPIPENDDCD